MIGNARQEVENWQLRSNETQQEQFELVAKKADAEKEFNAARKEVEALKRQPSNIPAPNPRIAALNCQFYPDWTENVSTICRRTD